MSSESFEELRGLQEKNRREKLPGKTSRSNGEQCRRFLSDFSGLTDKGRIRAGHINKTIAEPVKTKLTYISCRKLEYPQHNKKQLEKSQIPMLIENIRLWTMQEPVSLV